MRYFLAIINAHIFCKYETSLPKYLVDMIRANALGNHDCDGETQLSFVPMLFKFRPALGD